eukprot:gene3952-biopygen12321
MNSCHEEGVYDWDRARGIGSFDSSSIPVACH